MARAVALLTFLVWLAAPLAAQVSRGDSAWTEGRFADARSAYERALSADSTSVRALYRLGILTSWDGKLDSALVLIRRARAIEPLDPDVRVAEARILSWDDQLDAAIVLYDSALAGSPHHQDAAVGRAQLLARSDRLVEAEAAYAQVLRENPQNLDALVGLGYVYGWQGRRGLARAHADRALAIDPNNPEAQRLRDRVRMSTRPRLDLTVGWSDDSDRNTAWWQHATLAFPLPERWRGFVSLGALQATDPFRDASRFSGEAGVSFSGSLADVTVAAGARALRPDGPPHRTEATYRASVVSRVAKRVRVGVGFSHYPFDETALLIGRGLDINEFEGSAEIAMSPTLSVSAGGGGTWLSDDNRKQYGVVAVTQTIGRRFFVGGFGRIFGYERREFGYFSPDRFALGEVRAGYNVTSPRWLGRVSGGLGLQWIGSNGAAQEEWHLEARLARQWSSTGSAGLFASITNSAESSTTGAFRHGTGGVVVQLGL